MGIKEATNYENSAFYERFGGAEVLKYGELPDPVAATSRPVVRRCSRGECRTAPIGKCTAASVEDQGDFPLVLGRDFSGLVAATGPGIDDLKVGDAVFGVLEAGREGACLKSLRSRPRSSRRNPTGCLTSTPSLWRSPGSPRSVLAFAGQKSSQSHPCRARCSGPARSRWKWQRQQQPRSNRQFAEPASARNFAARSMHEKGM